MVKSMKSHIIYHIVWLFIIGSFFGYIFEVTAHFLMNGKLMNKPGLWFGPFKPIYGIGLILSTLLLYKFQDNNFFLILIIGIIIGSTFEYIAYVFQDKFFSIYTWNYKNMKFNIGGKIYPPYCLVWGLLSAFWIKYGLNIYLKIFNQAYNYNFKIITTFLLVLLIMDIGYTSLIINRYTKRHKNVIASNNIDKWIDKNYPNWKVKDRFPNLKLK